jgi:TonB family protein
MLVLALRWLEHLPTIAESQPKEEPPRVIARVRLVAPPQAPPPAAPPPPPAPAPVQRHPTPPPPVPASVSTPPPTPTPSGLKDKISIGPRGSRKTKEIVLRRDEPIPRSLQGDGVEGEDPGNRDAKTPAPATSTQAASAPAPGGTAVRHQTILGAFEEKLARRGTGLGVGPQSADFDFDPEGADFTEWLDHLRREVYRNWIIPQTVRMGFHGKVTIVCLVDRAGNLLRADVISSSGATSLDGAARGALLGSRYLPLPVDYGPPQLQMTVSFSYN